MANDWKSLKSWLWTHRFFNKDLSKNEAMIHVNPDHANLVSSFVYTDVEGTDYHRPLLDLDMDAQLIPSSTTGHHHLAIDKLMTAEQYDKLLNVLVEVGVVQQGILDLQWKQDGVTCLRVPGVKKEKSSLSSSGLQEFTSTVKTSDVVFNDFISNTFENDLTPVEVNDTMEASPEMIEFAQLMHLSNQAVLEPSVVLDAWKQFKEFSDTAKKQFKGLGGVIKTPQAEPVKTKMHNTDPF